jgi:hypothetical protein
LGFKVILQIVKVEHQVNKDQITLKPECQIMIGR